MKRPLAAAGSAAIALGAASALAVAPGCWRCDGFGARDAGGPAADGAAAPPCALDADCLRASVQGRCETNGYCTEPAAPADCYTGRVWGASAPPGEEPGACVPGEPLDACGCVADDDECTRDTCAAGACEHPADYDFNACTGGVCVDGACCTGCWNGAGCRSGTTRFECGQGGTMCTVCPLDDACMVWTCAGACAGEIVDAPGCPACGAADEPCCQGMACDAPLLCQFGLCGKDCFEWRCLP